jgi:hypothetical protein
MTNFQAAIQTLVQGGVKFIIVGAYAAIAHGSAYMTQDLDICYERTPENMKRLALTLVPFHPKLRGAPSGLPFLFDDGTIAQGMNFTLETDLGDIDLLGELSGIGKFPDLAVDAKLITVFGQSCMVASLDAIIRSKRAAGRAKDLAFLPELEALRDLQPREDKKPKPE